MSLLHAFQDKTPLVVVKRWVSVLPKKAIPDLPEVRFEMAFLSSDALAELAKDRSGRGTMLDLYQQREYREDFMEAALYRVEGLVKENARRLFAFFIEHEAAYKALPPVLFGINGADRIPRDEARAIGAHLAPLKFLEIASEAAALEEYALVLMEEEKKASAASSVSA